MMAEAFTVSLPAGTQPLQPSLAPGPPRLSAAHLLLMLQTLCITLQAMPMKTVSGGHSGWGGELDTGEEWC